MTRITVDQAIRLASLLCTQGKLDDALVLYDRAIAASPHDASLHSRRIHTLLYHPDYDAAAILREQVRWDRIHAQPLKSGAFDHGNARSSGRRLRVGYVSADFRNHVVGLNLLPLMREHDRDAFDVFCYANVNDPDRYTEQFRAYAGHWCDIAGMSDRQAADMIRADGIDLLIDCSLHSAGNRLLIFAQKPAPVQITFAGYPGGTGLETMDYRLSDPYLDPPGESDDEYREKTIRLPETFWCYDPDAMAAGMPADVAVVPPPGIRQGVITFGCLNNFCKVNKYVLRLWAEVMNQVAGSRLILLSPEGGHRQSTMDYLQSHGVGPDRIQFVPPQSRIAYLRQYHSIDIALDTFPYNGHTTSLDALWMGAAVVTLAGKTVVGRAGFSQLSNLGLTELVAHAPGQFVKIAAELAGDLPRLQRLRAGMRERMMQSPLTNAVRFTRHIEAAYRAALAM